MPKRLRTSVRALCLTKILQRTSGQPFNNVTGLLRNSLILQSLVIRPLPANSTRETPLTEDRKYAILFGKT